MHCIKLAALLDLLLDETAAIPERTLKQDGQVLHFVPGEEFLTERFRCPQADIKQPIAAFAAILTAREQHLQLFYDGRSARLGGVTAANDETALAVVAQERFGIRGAAGHIATDQREVSGRIFPDQHEPTLHFVISIFRSSPPACPRKPM